MSGNYHAKMKGRKENGRKENEFKSSSSFRPFSFLPLIFLGHRPARGLDFPRTKRHKRTGFRISQSISFAIRHSPIEAYQRGPAGIG